VPACAGFASATVADDGHGLWLRYEPLAGFFSDLDTVPKKHLLWFYRLSSDYLLPSRLTRWQAPVSHYDRGVAELEAICSQWSISARSSITDN
jgi:alpha-glucuronidase